MESKDRNPGKSENLFRSSFFRRLFLSYVLLILVSMAVFSAWYLYSYNVNQRTAIRENARQEASELHKNTLDYIDSLLADTDRKLSELINNIRLERNEIRNHR